MQPRQSIPADAAAVMRCHARSVQFSRFLLSVCRWALQVAWQGSGLNATWLRLYRWPTSVSTEFCICPIDDSCPLVGRDIWRATLSGNCAARSEEHTSELQSPCNL